MSGDAVMRVRSHFDKVLRRGLADWGPEPTRMWMSSLDTATGAYPEDDTRPADIPRRHYRAIDAPRGCALYWDQPLIVAAHALSGIVGDQRYARAADAYVGDFLGHCVARDGVFLWGNHYFWDVSRGCVVKFKGDEAPEPVDLDTESGDYHETRPIPPAWDLFARVGAQATETEIRTFVANSLFDPERGGFNRHADGKRGCAFLEAGGIIVESLSWLYERTGDRDLVETATRVASFSLAHRNEGTGLVENNPTVTRWDKHASTTEIGMFCGSLLRAHRRFGDDGELVARASKGVERFIHYAMDEAPGGCYGKVAVADGSPVLGEATGVPHAAHRPGDCADPWRPLFPAHDYPFQLGECCVELFRRTGGEAFRRGAEVLTEIVRRSLPARDGRGAYAEHYGRCIHLLSNCAAAFERPEFRALAEDVAREAVAMLYAQDMFRSHPGEDRYDAVDGLGYLFVSLLELETGRAIGMMGSGW